MLHFIKIVDPLTVFVTINSTLSHIYRDICSTHCYNTTQWYWAAQVGVYGVVCDINTHFAKKTPKKTKPTLFMTVFFMSFSFLSVENYLQFGSMATAQEWKAVSCAKAEQKIHIFFFLHGREVSKINEQNEQWCNMWAALDTFYPTDEKFMFRTYALFFVILSLHSINKWMKGWAVCAWLMIFSNITTHIPNPSVWAHALRPGCLFLV